ncbi:MAG: hypothetical protein ABIC40_01315 [bacterium]
MRIFACLLILLLPLMTLACHGEKKNPEPEIKRILPEDYETVQNTPPETPNAPDIEAYKLSVETEPENVLYRFQYMTALDQVDKTAEAIDQAYKLAAIEKDNPFRGVAYLNIADWVLKLPADAPDRDKKIKDAMDGLWIALGMDPSSIPAHLALGKLALEIGDNDKALHHLSIALSATEIGYPLRAGMAEIYIGKKEYDKAREHLEVAKKLAEKENDREYINKINDLMRKIR